MCCKNDLGFVSLSIMTGSRYSGREKVVADIARAGYKSAAELAVIGG